MEEEDEAAVLGEGIDEDYEAEDEFSLEAAAALDPDLPQEERTAALKEAIKICLAEQKDGPKKPAKKKAADLALIFGGKPE